MKINDEFLQNIIEGKYSKWIKVDKFNEHLWDTWQEKYAMLEMHHRKETSYLINVCKQLAEELINQRKLHGHIL